VNPSGSKRALIVHLPEAFAGSTNDLRHQNRFQAVSIARLLGERGFSVDVVRYRGHVPETSGGYDLVVDLHPGMTQVHARDAAVRIAYITGSNPAFSNKAEAKRVVDAVHRGRRGLLPRRQVPEFSEADLGRCDAMFFIGSERNLATYSGLRLPPASFIRNFAYPVPAIERTVTDPASFLFLASGGQVHKGLDLLLEVFSRNPQWTLHVCSNFHEEPEFLRAYRRELFGTRNIIPHGFQKLDSEEFAAIARVCSHVVLPSCSEANAGSVISGMSAWLVPVVSRECGFDDSEVVRLPDCSMSAIEGVLASRASTNTSTLSESMNAARRRAETHYTPKRFCESLASALDATLGERNLG
jgi:glycosyltransferase involved in cell wall biosynthesis